MARIKDAAAALDVEVTTSSGPAAPFGPTLSRQGVGRLRVGDAPPDLTRVLTERTLAAATAEYTFLIVLELADRSLKHTIVTSIAGKDWPHIRSIASDLAKALEHVHYVGIHADSPLSAVAVDSKFRLIDFDVYCNWARPLAARRQVPATARPRWRGCC